MDKITLSNSIDFLINKHTEIINDINTLIDLFIARACISTVKLNRET